jgi:hypothetical protein
MTRKKDMGYAKKIENPCQGAREKNGQVSKEQKQWVLDACLRKKREKRRQGNKIAHTFQKAFIQKTDSYDIRSTKIFRIGIL